MTTESIDIRITETGSRVVKRNIEDIGKAADGAEGSVGILKNAIAGVGAGLVVSKVAEYSKNWQLFQSRIRNSTSSIEEFNAVQEKLYAVSQRTGQSLDSVSSLYARLSTSAKELGVSQNQIIQFSETIGKVLSANNISESAASGALMQLGQALAGGTVRAEEFNSMLEGASPILQLVANNIEGANGSIAKLRAMMLDGKLTSEDFFAAVMRGSASVDAAFSKAPLTVGAAMQNLNNALSRYIGELDNSLGVSRTFASALQLITENINGVMGALSGLAVAVAAAFVPTAVNAFRAAIMSVFAVIRAHPFAMIAGAVASVIGYFYSMRDSIKILGDGITTLGDLFSVFRDQIVSALSSVSGFFSNVWQGVANQAAAVINSITFGTTDGTNEWKRLFGNFFAGVSDGWTGVAQGAARVADVVIATGRGLNQAYVQVWVEIRNAVLGIMKKLMSSVAESATAGLNVVIKQVNKVREFVGASALELIDFKKIDIDTQTFKTAGENIRKAFNAGVAQQDGAIEKWLNESFVKAQEKAKARLQKQANTFNLDTTIVKPPKLGGGLSADTVKAQREAAKQAEQATRQNAADLENLLRIVDPVSAAMRNMANDQQVLNRNFAAGSAELSTYSARLKDSYFEQTQPLQALRNEYAQLIDTESQLGQQRQIEQQLQANVQNLQRSGITLTGEETESLRQQIAVLQQVQEETRRREALLEQSIATQQRYVSENLRTMSELNRAGQFGQADLQNAMLNQFIVNQQAGTQAQLDQINAYYQQVNQLRANDYINEQTASAARRQLSQQEAQVRLNYANEFYGQLQNLQYANSKKLQRIGQAAAIAQALMNAHVAATKAWSQGGIYGAAMAAVTYAGAIAQVQAIRRQQMAGFAVGGSFKVGGTGSTDSQLVAFRATPGEEVSVRTPTQVRKGTGSFTGEGGSAPEVNVTPKIINVFDDSLVSDYLKTNEGEKVIVNIMLRNKRELV